MPLAPDSCQRPFIWSVAFVSVRDSLSGSQAADEGPQDEPDDMRPGLLANIPGMSLSGVCPRPVGCVTVMFDRLGLKSFKDSAAV